MEPVSSNNQSSGGMKRLLDVPTPGSSLQGRQVTLQSDSIIPYFIFPQCPELDGLIFDYLGTWNRSEDWKKLRLVSKPCKIFLDNFIIERLNNGKSIFSDFVPSLTNGINFFGDRCKEIFTLDVHSFSHITTFDFEKIAKSFQNLKHLYTCYASITSYGAFKKMQSLETLSLKRCCIYDISFLTKMKSLKTFRISPDNLASSILYVSLLCDCIGLQHLNFKFCKFYSFDFLKKMTGLVSLSMTHCHLIDEKENILIPDSLSLENSPNLKELKLSGLNIKKIKFPEKGISLTKLAIENCTNLENVIPTLDCSKIETLFLGGVKCENFDFFEKMTSLKKLRFACAHLTNYSSITKAHALEEIEFEDIAIEDTDFLPKLTSLKTLSFYDCSIENFSFLHKMLSLMPSLRNFWFGDKLFHLPEDLDDFLAFMAPDDEDMEMDVEPTPEMGQG